MNTKVASLVVSIVISGLGCSTLQRPDVAHPVAAGESRIALASGPALVQLSSYGAGTARLYLTDDPGTGSTTCAAAETEAAGSVKVLDGDDYAGDVAVPRGKRICAVVDNPRLGLDWLAEDYAPASATAATPPPARAPALSGTLMARR
jgi:hypothetical protein